MAGSGRNKNRSRMFMSNGAVSLTTLITFCFPVPVPTYYIVCFLMIIHYLTSFLSTSLYLHTGSHVKDTRGDTVRHDVIRKLWRGFKIPPWGSLLEESFLWRCSIIVP